MMNVIFITNPYIKVTGIDLTKVMLDVLKQKHPDKNITLINASYFDSDFGIEKFDAVLSFQTLHHFSHDKKIKLYSKVYSALKPGGKYIKCDYMVIEQKDEDGTLKKTNEYEKSKILQMMNFIILTPHIQNSSRASLLTINLLSEASEKFFTWHHSMLWHLLQNILSMSTAYAFVSS